MAAHPAFATQADDAVPVYLLTKSDWTNASDLPLELVSMAKRKASQPPLVSAF